MMRYLIAIPAMDMCPVAFAYSLATMRRVGASRISVISGAAVHEARNVLAREAVESGADRVLWLDSDMRFDEDIMERLGADMDAGYDLVCGIYTKRRLPATPVIYRTIDAASGRAEPYPEYPREAVFDIAGCGFGAVMCSTALLKAVGAGPFTPTDGLSEDLSFCLRAGRIGARMACDSRVKVGHVGLMEYGEGMSRRRDG